jgi:hypothetical protein
MGNCAVQEFCADGVIVRNASGETEKLACDTAVTAFGVKPERAVNQQRHTARDAQGIKQFDTPLRILFPHFGCRGG